MQREYQLSLNINGRSLKKVVIDPHYEIKHSDSINDALILKLVKTLNGEEFQPETVRSNGWEIYAVDPLYLAEKAYRLVFCLHPDAIYVGVINAFRRPNA